MTIETIIKDSISKSLKYLNVDTSKIVLEHPSDFSMGDFSTNIAMVHAKDLGMSPKDFAVKLVDAINEDLPEEIARVDVAGPGFINFYLSPVFFANSLKNILNKKDFGTNHLYKGKKVMIEYTDPNPFKPFHIGHLMTNAIGESLARIFDYSGADVSRANYQGDVGLHVARAIWGLMHNAHLQKEDDIPNKLKAANIGIAYAYGSEHYEANKEEIDAINKKIYNRSDEVINKIYDWGFKVTMEAFEDIYKLLGTQFDFYFLESQMAPVGEEIVKNNTGKVFEASDGAIVFKADKHDPKLHTRVFITSQGLPAYETKELGLTVEKFKTMPNMDLSIVITANEQADYMKVVAKAISLIYPEYASKMKHITHGMMQFASGKMSSRKGNVITGESLLNDVKLLVVEKIADRQLSQAEMEEIADSVCVAAIKYSILKQAIGGNMIYDFDKSISFEGDSGPYLQYSHARANSILEKAKNEGISSKVIEPSALVTETEKLLYRFESVVHRAAEEFAPHYIASYLIELARSFNSFYGNTQIVNKEDALSSHKVALTEAFSTVMKNGLHLLGIKAPEKM